MKGVNPLALKVWYSGHLTEEPVRKQRKTKNQGRNSGIKGSKTTYWVTNLSWI